MIYIINYLPFGLQLRCDAQEPARHMRRGTFTAANFVDLISPQQSNPHEKNRGLHSCALDLTGQGLGESVSKPRSSSCALGCDLGASSEQCTDRNNVPMFSHTSPDTTAFFVFDFFL